MEEFFNQIKNKKYKEIDSNIFETIQYEGLDEEFDVFNQNDWEFIELELNQEQIVGLKKFEKETVELFNLFDIKLKENFKKHIDLIDYDNGIIRIVRPKKL